MQYPIIFKPLYKNNIWGGRKLENMGKTLPEGIVGESWEIASHPDGTGIVSSGEYAGKRLDDLTDEFGPELLGSAIYNGKGTIFPLLIKFIDANRDLSVQVHPDDDYAFAFENGELGKSEAWYVVDAEPGAKLVSGVKNGTTKAGFIKAIEEGTVKDCLNYVEVNPGDCYNIPAGLVHAIGSGCLICEIQQNSNTTYRVYDYDRTDSTGKKRQLHIEKALDVIDFNAGEGKKVTGLTPNIEDFSRTYFVANKYFAIELLKFQGIINEDTEGERFHCYTVLDGEIEINGTVIEKGHSCLIPADAGAYAISGNAKVIKSYVPDLEKNIYEPLQHEGFTREQIDSIIS
ncbi:MAG: type I phosphomannose isomerase catalytic subunit [Clostridia bacterium]|nr:type I phosphomannose isomerase catalytic subunit [Clostridia bacterium]